MALLVWGCLEAWAQLGLSVGEPTRDGGLRAVRFLSWWPRAPREKVPGDQDGTSMAFLT